MMILEDSRILFALLDPVYEGTMTFRNVGNYLPVDMASRPGIADSSAVPLSEPQISLLISPPAAPVSCQ